MRMLNIGWLAAVAFAASLVLNAATVRAAEVQLDGEVELGVASAFVWRGEVINDEPVIQPSVTLRAVGLMLNIWGTWDLTDVPDDSNHDRVDATLDYTHIWGRNLLSVGSIAYIYHDEPDSANRDTYEAYLGYTLDVPTLPSLAVYYDFGEIDGVYATFSLAHSFEFVEKQLALDLGMSVGAGNEDYTTAVYTLAANEGTGFEGFVPEDASLVDLQATVHLPVGIGESFTVMPGFKYTRLIDPNIRNAVRAAGDKDDEAIWSISGILYF